jgi:hypothetical protein
VGVLVAALPSAAGSTQSSSARIAATSSSAATLIVASSRPWPGSASSSPGSSGWWNHPGRLAAGDLLEGVGSLIEAVSAEIVTRECVLERAFDLVADGVTAGVTGRIEVEVIRLDDDLAILKDGDLERAAGQMFQDLLVHDG